MEMVTIKKSQFAGLKDQRYFFSEDVTFFPNEHPLLEPLREKEKI